MKPVEGNNAFATKIFRVAVADGENLIFSPMSLYGALTMVWAGARSETAAEMARTMEYRLGAEEIHPVLGVFFADLEKTTPGAELKLVNRLWGQTGHDFLPEFLSLIGQSYRAGIGQLDFRQPEEARQAINWWVEKRTSGRIRNLISSGVLTPLTRLVITNAVYFRADWELPFPREGTTRSPFFISSKEKVEVDLMHVVGHFRYLEAENFQAVELPYAAAGMAMTVIIPSAGVDPSSFSTALQPNDTVLHPEGWPRRRVEVYLPRFRLLSSLRLDETLKGLGIARAFSEEADFSGIDGGRSLSISAVLHQAWIEVDEAGTEVAAATAVGIGVTAVPAPPVVFRADRPFAFMIRQRSSGVVIFWGRLVKPLVPGQAS